MDETEHGLWVQLDALYSRINEILIKLSSLRPGDKEGEESGMGRNRRLGELVKKEIQRSHRYNHYCVAAMVEITGRKPSEIMQTALKCFRKMDMVDLLESELGRAHEEG